MTLGIPKLCCVSVRLRAGVDKPYTGEEGMATAERVCHQSLKENTGSPPQEWHHGDRSLPHLPWSPSQSVM